MVTPGAGVSLQGAGIAFKAYPELTEAQIERQALMKFCQGCTDKAAGHFALSQWPRSLDSALEAVKRYQHTDQELYGKARRDQVPITTVNMLFWGRHRYRAFHVLSLKFSRYFL